MEKGPLELTPPLASYRGMLKLKKYALSTQRDLQFNLLISPINSKVAIPWIM
jgi:hypothetical protein